MSNHDWKEVELRARGQWRDILGTLAGITEKELSKRHGPCPACGGKDRFRFDDNIESPGDGGYVCGQCGSGAGISLLMKVTSESFPVCVNNVCEFLNMQPVERMERNSKAIASAVKESLYSKQDPEKAALAINKAQHVPMCELTLRHGIGPNGLLTFGTSIVCPVTDIDSNLVNVAVIKLDESVVFAAGSMTYGCATVVGADTGKSVILCVSWFDAWHLHHATSCMILVCWEAMNAWQVANNYLNKYPQAKPIIMACNIEFNELAAAEMANLNILTPAKTHHFENNGAFSGVERKLHCPSDILDKMEANK